MVISLKALEKAIHFFRRVVVRQPDAQKAAVFLYIQMFGEVQSIVVAIPGEETRRPSSVASCSGVWPAIRIATVGQRASKRSGSLMP